MRAVSNQPSAISRTREQGFTLLEVMLSSFIFMSVVTIAIGSFTSQLTLQSTSQAQRNVQQTGQAIMEAIVRDLKTREEFTVQRTAACRVLSGAGVSCGTELVFVVQPGADKRYRLMPTNDIRVFDPGGGQNNLNDISQVVVTDFLIEAVEPDVVGRTNLTQPFAIIHLTVETAPGARVEEQFRLQLRTMVTSRLFDKYAQ